MTKASGVRGLSARIASPSSFSLPTWIVAFAPSFTTAVLHDRNLYGGSVAGWAMAAGVGALAAGAVLALAAAVSRGRRSLPLVLTVFLIAGAARGIGVGITVALLGLAPSSQLNVRAASGTVLAAFWLSIATLIVDGFRRHRSTRMKLQAVTTRAEAEYRTAVSDLAEIRSRMRVDVLARVRDISTRLADAENVRATQLRETAAELHDLSAEVVRPLSHAAVAAMPAPAESTVSTRSGVRTLRVIASDTITVDPFRPGWTATLLFPSILLTAVRAYGPGLGLLGAAWIALSAALVLLVARRTLTPNLRRLPPVVRMPLVVGVWAVAGVASSTPVLLASSWGLGPERAWAVFGVPLLVYVPVTCLGLAIASAITQAWALDEDEQRARIEELTWRTRRTAQEAWAERTRLGRYLHGSIQSTLTSTALLIESALIKNEDHRVVARQAAQRLATVDDDLPLGDPTDVPAVLEQLASVWGRLTDIHITLTPNVEQTLAHDFGAAEHVVDIVREALANAVRHGRATRVDVVIETADGPAFRVTITDNGRFTESSATGLGTAELETACLDWSRTPVEPAGTQLMCRIPATREGAASPQPA